MLKTYRYIKRYGLKVVEIKNIDLSKIYFQYQPNIDYDRILTKSPHFELAQIYYNNGLKWLNKNFKSTKYFMFQKDILQVVPRIITKKIHLFDSIKKGYLREGYTDDYIVILNDPLICTRYAVNLKLPAPEVFMGHHRAGALLALGINIAKVIVAKDVYPGTCRCYGRIHDIYNGIKDL